MSSKKTSNYNTMNANLADHQTFHQEAQAQTQSPRRYPRRPSLDTTCTNSNRRVTQLQQFLRSNKLNETNFNRHPCQRGFDRTRHTRTMLVSISLKFEHFSLNDSKTNTCDTHEFPWFPPRCWDRRRSDRRLRGTSRCSRGRAPCLGSAPTAAGSLRLKHGTSKRVNTNHENQCTNVTFLRSTAR